MPLSAAFLSLLHHSAALNQFQRFQFLEAIQQFRPPKGSIIVIRRRILLSHPHSNRAPLLWVEFLLLLHSGHYLQRCLSHIVTHGMGLPELKPRFLPAAWLQSHLQKMLDILQQPYRMAALVLAHQQLIRDHQGSPRTGTSLMAPISS